MSEYIDALIFDRTQADVDNMTAKGCIDYNDLNRVERAIRWISYVLNKYGYQNEIQMKVWKEEFRTDTEMERLRKNISIIRNAYYTDPDTPLTPSKITYTSLYQANAIEKILYDLGKLVENSFPGPQHYAFKLGTRSLGNRSISV